MGKKTSIDTFAKSIGSIDIKMYATHLNYVNGNDVLYTVPAAKLGIKSWTKPYQKSQLVHHDKHADPIGRIIDAKVIHLKDQQDDLDEPQDLEELTIRISDEKAIGSVLKGLYYTGSVGSRTTRVRCSSCGQVLTEDGLCDHEKGSTVDGKTVHWIIDELTYTENSFVNVPADPYSRIVAINLGKGFTPYKEFLDNKDTLINELIVEDSMKLTDAKLSTEARNKLSVSSFCGPGRSFPAHDKAHVTAGLRLLNRSNFSESTKAKIKACLYRKGKKYGMAPSEDELETCPNIATFRINDEFTSEEQTQIEKYFKENPDADLPSNDSDESSTTPVVETPVVVPIVPTEPAVETQTDDIKIKSETKVSLIKSLGSKELDVDKIKEWMAASKATESHVLEVACSLLHSIYSVVPEDKTEGSNQIDEAELAKGVIFESAHTNDKDLAAKFAKDILAKDSTFYTKLEKANQVDELKVKSLEEEVKKLNDQLSDSQVILNSKEDEINKLVDSAAMSEETYRQTLVDSLADLKIATKEFSSDKREELKNKYNRRQINSLVDTINDLRTEFNIQNPVSTDHKVDDPTLKSQDQVNNNDGATKVETTDEVILPEGLDPKFAPFYKNREDK